MKKGWEYKKLGEVCKTYAGGTPLKTCKEYYDGGTIPWLRSGEVCRKYIDSTELFITQKGMDNSSAKYYPVNTIVVAMYGATAAQVGILKIESTSNQAVCGILPNDRFVPEFLFYWFTYIKDFLASQAQGGAQPNISQVKIKNLTTPVPPLSEQKEIVEYLDSSFAKIDKLKGNAAKNLDEAKALFQSALKDALEPKKGWEEKTINDVVLFRNGIAHEKDIDKGGNYIVINSKFVATEGTIRKYTNEQLSPLYTNEIVMVMSDVPKGKTLAKCYIIDCDNKYSLNQRICAFKSKGLDVKFLYYMLNRNPNLLKYDNGENQTNLRKNQILECPVTYPVQKNEQQEIVDKLDSLKSKVDRLQENFDKISMECDALKQAILRQVFE